MRPWRNPVVHELLNVLHMFSIRDRLRCPRCRAVGTWKPHGSLYDRRKYDDRPVRRWVCKWCGLYAGPEDTTQVIVNPDRKVWDFIENYPDGTTPREVISTSSIPNTDPWRG